MSDELIERLKALKIGNYIYAIFALISLLGLYANKKEKDFLFYKDSNGSKKAHRYRLIILGIALLVYIYFLENRIKKRESSTNKFFNNLDILSAILFIIGAIISIYLECKGDEAAIITE